MDVTITPAADRFIRRLMKFAGGPQYGFRLAVTPGGCSGMSAEFGPEASPKGDEELVLVGDLRLFLNAASRKLLEGVTIDFAETPTSTGFVFVDPKHKCGCSSIDNVPSFPELVQLS